MPCISAEIGYNEGIREIVVYEAAKLPKLKMENGKLKIIVSALPTISIISEGNTLIFNFQFSIINWCASTTKQQFIILLQKRRKL